RPPSRSLTTEENPMTRRFVVLLFLAACASLGLARHYQSGKTEERAEKDDRAADRAAIHKTLQQLLKALRKGDAEAVASFWTDTGEYIDEEGEIIRGRKPLEDAYKKFFAKTRGLEVKGKTDDLRFLGRDAAVADGVFERVGTKDFPATSARFAALL